MSDIRYVNYYAEGRDAESFRQEMEKTREGTYVRMVQPFAISLLSFREKKEVPGGEDGIPEYRYRFYEISAESLRDLKQNGIPLKQKVIRIMPSGRKRRDRLRYLDEITETSGLMMLVENEDGGTDLYGVSKYAIQGLCAKSDCRGERINKKSLCRDLYISDGLFDPGDDGRIEDMKEIRRSCKLTEEGLALVVRDGEGEIGTVINVTTGGYESQDVSVICEIYDMIRKDPDYSGLTVVGWDSDQRITHLQAEFPDEAYAAGGRTAMIPGIEISSSDCGRRSLTVKGTLRIKGQPGRVVYADISRKHGKRFDTEEIVAEVKESILKKMGTLPVHILGLEERCLLVNRPLRDPDAVGRHTQAYLIAEHLLKGCGIKQVIGQKRYMKLRDLLEDDLGSRRRVTAGCAVRQCMILALSLEDTECAVDSETAKEQLERCLALIPYVDLRGFTDHGKGGGVRNAA